MKTIIKIEGMTCEHCKARVEKALNAIEGVSAVVNLEKKEAAVTISGTSDNVALKSAVEAAGYDVISIENS